MHFHLSSADSQNLNNNPRALKGCVFKEEKRKAKKQEKEWGAMAGVEGCGGWGGGATLLTQKWKAYLGL